MAKKFDELDSTELIEEINNWEMKEDYKNKLLAYVKNEKIGGDTLAIIIEELSKDNLSEQWNISIAGCNVVVCKIKAQIKKFNKPQDYNEEAIDEDEDIHLPRNNNNGININDLLGGEDEKKDETFYPTILFGSTTKTRKWIASPQWTVKRFKEEFVAREVTSDVSKYKDPQVVMSAFGKILEDGKTLISYGINSDLHTITVIIRLRGGSQKEKKKFIRKIDVTHPLLKNRLTQQEDCINGENSPNVPRAKLTCGHVYCAETWYNSIQHQFETDNTLTDVSCPQCKTSIPWQLAACVAALSRNEFRSYTIILKKRRREQQRKKFANCPFCKGLILKPDNLSINRVSCHCKKSTDFCFCCLKLWKKGGFQICGNEECATYQIQLMLSQCPDAEFHGQKCPQVRACPKCLQVVLWKDACKHIICPNQDCKYQFCLVCLQEYVQNNHYQSACQIAPRQQLN